MHTNSFENPLEIITLHFLARQLTVFSYAIHNIEKKSTSVAEMKTVYLYLLFFVLLVMCFVLFCLCIFNLICFVCTSVRTAATK